MEPRIVHRGESLVVGIEYVGKSDGDEIPRIWNHLISGLSRISNRINPSIYYCVSRYFRDSDDRSHLACVEVSSLDNVPEGMSGLTVPAGRYAVFTHKGELTELHATYRSIYETWLPKAGLEPTSLLDFQYYDHRFGSDPNSSVLDIYVQLK